MPTLVKNKGAWKMPTKTFIKKNGYFEQIDGQRETLTLNGVSQYAIAPTVSEIDFSTTVSLSVSLKVKFASTVPQYLIWQGDAENKIRFALYCLNSRFNLYLGSARNEIPFDLSAGIDYEIAIDIVDDSAIVTINDFEYTAIFSRNAPTVDTVTEKLYISGRYDIENGVALLTKGQLSNLRIWTGGDRNTGTLTRDYRFDDGWGLNPTLKDYSGNNNDGTYIGLTEASWTQETV